MKDASSIVERSMSSKAQLEHATATSVQGISQDAEMASINPCGFSGKPKGHFNRSVLARGSSRLGDKLVQYVG